MREKEQLAELPPHLASKFIDTMPICFSYWDENLNAVYCNQAYIALFNLKSPDEYKLRHREFSPKFQPNGQTSFELGHMYISTTLEKGQCRFEWLHQNLSGELIPTEVTLLKSIHNNKPHISCYLRDMRDDIANKNIIQSGKKHKQFLLDTMPLATQTWSKDFKLVECSRETLHMFDLESEQEFFDNFNKLSPELQPSGERSLEKIETILKEVFEIGYSRFDWTHMNLKGELIPCDVTLVRGEQNGEPVMQAYLVDLRKHYENIKKLRTAEQHTKLLLDTCPLGTLIWDKDFKLIGSNKAIAKIFGLQEDFEFIDNFLDLIPEFQPDGVVSLERMFGLLQDCLENGTAQTYWIGQKLDKTPIPTEVSLARVEHDGQYMIAGYIKDLSELEESLQKAQAAEEFSEAMLNGLPLAISIQDSTFKRIDCNNTMVELFGFNDKQDAIENSIKMMPLLQPNGEDSFELSRKKYLEVWEKGEINFEVTAQHVNGTPIPVDIKLIRSVVNDKDIIIAYILDLRDTKANIKKLQEAEARVQVVIDSSPLCINTFDKNGKLVDCNDAAWKIFGLKSKSDFLQNFYKLFPEKQPDGRPSIAMIRDALDKALECGQCRLKATSKTIQGEIIPCDVTLISTTINGEKSILSYVQDLREINIALKKAHKATQAAERSAKAKSEFLANMSHEIRTPMNGILGLLHILSRTNLNATQKDYLEKTALSANNLLRIINDILDFSKIEAGKLEIEETQFKLHDVCQELEDLFIPQIEEKKLKYILNEGEFSNTTIIGDPTRLKQVLINLIGNAIKFTNQGSITLDIEATVQKLDELHCTFIISDTGIGLTKAQSSNLFLAFTQADASVTRKYGGTGLGLTISKSIVEMMQGKIWVESSKGKGSKFSFTAVFKLQLAEDKPHANANTVSTEPTFNKAHLLLVEDNDINQIIAEELLTSVGYTLDIANNGLEAIKMLDKKNYDLVFMDIQMPVMDGLTAAKKIRNIDKFKNLTIIAMSAHAMSGDKEISLAHGMNDHITKPISPALLYSTLDFWLNKK